MPAEDVLWFSCPRCGEDATARTYGPCASCRDQLVQTFWGHARAVDADRFEPAMHVTPNHVATKD